MENDINDVTEISGSLPSENESLNEPFQSSDKRMKRGLGRGYIDQRDGRPDLPPG